MQTYNELQQALMCITKAHFISKYRWVFLMVQKIERHNTPETVA